MNEPGIFGEWSPERKILSDIKNKPIEQESDPMSPTANLKLLTKVASNLNNANESMRKCKQPNITKRLKGQSLLSFGHNQDKNICKTRKEKSLGVLCDKFLKLYPLNMKSGTVLTVSLHEAAIEIGTERRRLYDIVNVLEGLQMAVKVAKNQYKWFGRQNLHLTLRNLKALASQVGLKDQVQLFQMKKRMSTAHVCQSNCKIVSNLCVESKKKTQTKLQIRNDEDLFLKFPTENDNKWHSLGVMCQKFIMLFLIQNQNDTVSFDLAANVLLNKTTIKVEEIAYHEDKDQIESQNRKDMNLHCCQNGNDYDNNTVNKHSSGQLKTKLRRLYDIANVLMQLGLIRKTEHVKNELRKRTFIYTGPLVEMMEFTSEELNLIQPSRHSLLGQDPYIFLKKKSYLNTFEEYVNPRKNKHTKRKYEPCKSEIAKYQLKEEDNDHISQEHEGNKTSLNRIFFQVAEMELKNLESMERMPHKKSQAEDNISENQFNPKRARKKLFTQGNYDLKTTETTTNTAIMNTVVSSTEVIEHQLGNASSSNDNLNSTFLINLATNKKTEGCNSNGILAKLDCIPSISILKSEASDSPEPDTSVVPPEACPTKLYQLIKVANDMYHLVPLCNNSVLCKVPVLKPL